MRRAVRAENILRAQRVSGCIRPPLELIVNSMSNSLDAAVHWIRFLSSRSYIPSAHLLQQHFASGQVSRLCQCGCQSFDLTIPADAVLEPLVPASDRGGFALDVSYYTLERVEPRRTVSLLVFTDARGFLCTLEVNYQGNTSDMPEQVQLEEPPFRISGSFLALPSNPHLERP